MEYDSEEIPSEDKLMQITHEGKKKEIKDLDLFVQFSAHVFLSEWNS